MSELAKQLYKIPEAEAILGLSRSALYEQMRAGRLRFVKRGRSRRITVQAITDYVRLLEQEREADGET